MGKDGSLSAAEVVREGIAEARCHVCGQVWLTVTLNDMDDDYIRVAACESCLGAAFTAVRTQAIVEEFNEYQSGSEAVPVHVQGAVPSPAVSADQSP